MCNVMLQLRMAVTVSCWLNYCKTEWPVLFTSRWTPIASREQFCTFSHQNKNWSGKWHGYRSVRIMGWGADQRSLQSAVYPLGSMEQSSISRFCSNRDDAAVFQAESWTRLSTVSAKNMNTQSAVRQRNVTILNLKTVTSTAKKTLLLSRCIIWNWNCDISGRPLFQERPYTLLYLDQLQEIDTSNKKLRLKQLGQTFLGVCAFQGTIRAQVLLDFFLSHSSPVHISKSPFQKTISTLSSHLGPRLSSDSSHQGYRLKRWTDFSPLRCHISRPFIRYLKSINHAAPHYSNLLTVVLLLLP